MLTVPSTWSMMSEELSRARTVRTKTRMFDDCLDPRKIRNVFDFHLLLRLPHFVTYVEQHGRLHCKHGMACDRPIHTVSTCPRWSPDAGNSSRCGQRERHDSNPPLEKIRTSKLHRHPTITKFALLKSVRPNITI